MCFRFYRRASASIGGYQVWFLPARYGSDDQEWLLALDHLLRERCIGTVVREVFLAGKEAEERPANSGDLVADRPSQRRVARFHGVEHGPEGRRLDLHLHVALDLREPPQKLRQLYPDGHGSVCTSTDNTAGRSRTMAFQVSPPSADAYTWP